MAIKRNLLTTIITLFAIGQPLFAQRPVGQWTTHIAYNNITNICLGNDRIYGTAEGSLFSVDKTDGEIRQYSKATGLNGNNISKICYDGKRDALIIFYNNGLVDIMHGEYFEPVLGFYSTQGSMNKEPNDLYLTDDYAYIGMDFGILVFDLRRHEFSDTYYIGDNATEVNVTHICVNQDTLYAVTSNAICYAPINKAGIENFANWNKMTALPGANGITQLTSFQDRLIMIRDSIMYDYCNGQWHQRVSPAICSINSSNNHLIASTPNSTIEFDKDLSYSELTRTFVQTKVIVYDPSSKDYWFTSGTEGIGVLHSNGTTNHFRPNGPLVNTPYNMRFFEDTLYVVGGGRSYAQFWRGGDLMRYDGEWWSGIYGYDTAEQLQSDFVYDFCDVAIDPSDPSHTFVSSYGTGLVEFRNMKPVKLYNYYNSTITPTLANPDKYSTYTRTDALMFDEQGNLWVDNCWGGSFQICILKTNGEWTKIFPKNSQGIKHASGVQGNMFIDSRKSNYKWITGARTTAGLTLLDDNGTPTEESDDRSIFRTEFYDQYDNLLTFERVNKTVQDKNNDLWLATSSGIIIIPASTDFFTSNRCRRVTIPRNDGTNLVDYLLENEEITDIAIDGSNRKWIGTEQSGLFLLSADGVNTIQHFTTDNSPLLSNTILSLAINERTGEVFIGTSIGLIAYQSDAAEGNQNFKEISVSPNPVRRDYQGFISISGLVEGSYIKIIDGGGTLVCQTYSNGGLATWDGKTSGGDDAANGVYIVQCVTGDGKLYGMTKILLMR